MSLELGRVTGLGYAVVISLGRVIRVKCGSDMKGFGCFLYEKLLILGLFDCLVKSNGFRESYHGFCLILEATYEAGNKV